MRSSGPRPSPSPATPELAPHLWDPLWVPATNAAAPLLEHSALLLPGSCSRSVGYLRTVIPRLRHRRRGLSGGERLRRRLPGAEAATEEAAAAVIMTCFVVGMWLYVLCFWVAMHAVCVLNPGAPAEIT